MGKMSRMLRKVGSYVIALLVLPCLLLLALEGLARLAAPDDLTLRKASANLIDGRDGQFPYVLRAGYQGHVWQKEVNVNSLHLRSPEPHAFPDTTDVVRLLLLGDSVMFGQGLSDEEAPTALL